MEGAEGLVLSGARKLLQDDRPIWFVEISDFGNRFNGRAEDIFEDFLALNYEPFIYTLDGRFEKKTMLKQEIIIFSFQKKKLNLSSGIKK